VARDTFTATLRLPHALFPLAGLLQAAPWLWYAIQASTRGLPTWAAPAFALVAFVLVAASLWSCLQPRGVAVACLVALCGASFTLVSLTSMFLGNALLELLTAASLGLASLGAAWLRWLPRKEAFRRPAHDP
jgi:hypothetical protein